MKRLLCALCLLLPSVSFAQDMRYVPLQFSSWNHATSGISTLALNSTPGVGTTDWIELCTQAKEAATITKLSVYFSSETGTGPTFKIGMEGLDATTGEANGTYKTGTGECSGTLATDGQTAGWKDITLTGTTCSVTRGEKFCITIKHSSGTIDVSNNATFGYSASGDFNDGGNRYSPVNEYAVTASNQNNTAGLGTKSNELPIFMYKSSSRTFGRPFTAAGSTTYSSDSAEDEIGNRFIFNCPSGMKYYLAGVRWHGQTASAAKSVIISLYDDETSPASLQNVTWDADNEQASAGSNRTFEQYFDESSLTQLDCGADYVIALAVQETASNFALRYFDVGANGDLDAFPGGIETYKVGRADGTGNFATVTTRRADIDLIIDDLVDPAAGGGLITSPTANGGSQ